jgi:ABC-type uncharacterized transport system substrate-binding protein
MGLQGLQEAGWAVGRNVQIDIRWGDRDVERNRKNVGELVALTPDAILATTFPLIVALQQATREVPIVFAGIIDPVGAGLVASLARPGGNTTGLVEFIALVSGTAAAWPLAAGAQQPDHVRRIGILMYLASDDADAQSRNAAFLQGLQELGWTVVLEHVLGDLPHADYSIWQIGTDYRRSFLAASSLPAVG